MSWAFAILSDLRFDARPIAAMFLKLRWLEAASQFVEPLLDRTGRLSDGEFLLTDEGVGLRLESLGFPVLQSGGRRDHSRLHPGHSALVTLDSELPLFSDLEAVEAELSEADFAASAPFL